MFSRFEINSYDRGATVARPSGILTTEKGSETEWFQTLSGGADDTAFDEKITYHSESKIS